ncbi:uncharacterized protein [Manis javanica]|uniref:uncharacterized protein n=1 Tax=Manis javanica TaxID=9974 RepID=UPI003C6CD8B9
MGDTKSGHQKSLVDIRVTPESEYPLSDCAAKGNWILGRLIVTSLSGLKPLLIFGLGACGPRSDVLEVWGSSWGGDTEQYKEVTFFQDTGPARNGCRDPGARQSGRQAREGARVPGPRPGPRGDRARLARPPLGSRAEGGTLPLCLEGADGRRGPRDSLGRVAAAGSSRPPSARPWGAARPTPLAARRAVSGRPLPAQVGCRRAAPGLREREASARSRPETGGDREPCGDGAPGPGGLPEDLWPVACAAAGPPRGARFGVISVGPGRWSWGPRNSRRSGCLSLKHCDFFCWVLQSQCRSCSLDTYSKS